MKIVTRKPLWSSAKVMLQSEKVYECPTCEKTFNRRSYLQLHEKIHGEKSYKCSICDKTFRQPAGLWIHKKRQSCLKRNLPSNKPCNPPNVSGQFDEKTDDDGKRHKCDICSKRFTQKHLLTYHKRTHTGENPFPCTICGKMFRGAATLKYHERTHTGQKPHKCIFCAKAFTQLGPLRLHCRKEHQSEKIYECKICKQQFEKFREISFHKKTHLELLKQARESPSPADQSEAPFKEVAEDEKHEELQSTGYETSSESSIETFFVSEGDKKGENQVAISSCSSVYAKEKKRKCVQSSNKSKGTARRTRSKISTKDSMKTSPKNEICFSAVDKELSASMVFKRTKTIPDFGASSLDEQMLAGPVNEECEDGKKYKCNVCSQEFSQAHVLKYHMRIHTGENPHSCTDCSKTFRTPGALTVHLRTHNGQKPYKCVFCYQGFTQRGALLQHCKRIHFSDQIYECGVCKEKFEKYRDLSLHSHIHSSVSCSMAKQIDKKVDEDEDELFSTISPLNVSMAECHPEKETNSLVSAETCIVSDSGQEKHSMKLSNEHAENEITGNSSIHIKHERDDNGTYTENNSQVLDSCHDVKGKHFTNSPYRAYKEIGNMDVSFLDECLPGNIRQDKEECGRSSDSGISPDTSPLDVVVECNEHESDLIYEVSMQPIKVEKTIENTSSNPIASIPISPGDYENCSPVVVDKCSKTPQESGNSLAIVVDACSAISDNDGMSSCSRVTTPDVDQIFSYCSEDFQNCFFEKESETRSSCQFRQNYEGGNPISSSNYPLEKNSNPSTSMDVQPNCTDLNLLETFSDHSNHIRLNSEVNNSNDNKLYQDVKCDSNTCESLSSNAWEHLEDHRIVTENDISLFSQNSVSRIPNDDKMCFIAGQDERKCQCLGFSGKTNITLDELQQNSKFDYGQTSSTHNICFKCDVLPASFHLGQP